jgi:hypothetical protein
MPLLHQLFEQNSSPSGSAGISNPFMSWLRKFSKRYNRKGLMELIFGREIWGSLEAGIVEVGKNKGKVVPVLN